MLNFNVDLTYRIAESQCVHPHEPLHSQNMCGHIPSFAGVLGQSVGAPNSGHYLTYRGGHTHSVSPSCWTMGWGGHTMAMLCLC